MRHWFLGFVAAEILPHVKSILGVDISQGMVRVLFREERRVMCTGSRQVDTYNARAEKVGASPEAMRAVCVELKGTGSELDGRKFDLVIVRTRFYSFFTLSASSYA